MNVMPVPGFLRDSIPELGAVCSPGTQPPDSSGIFVEIAQILLIIVKMYFIVSTTITLF